MLAGGSFGQTGKQPVDELDISTMRATFTGCPPGGPFPPKPPVCATDYSIQVLDAPAGAKLHYEWFIQLKLINQEGASDPGSPGSGANFDPTCNNAELPGGKVVEGKDGQSGVVYSWQDMTDLVWYHGDVGVYSDRPLYGCDHTRDGTERTPGDQSPSSSTTRTRERSTRRGCARRTTTARTPGSAPRRTRTAIPSRRCPASASSSLSRGTTRSRRSACSSRSTIRPARRRSFQHSLDDLKQALAKEKSFPLSDPYWVSHIERAIKDDEEELKDLGPRRRCGSGRSRRPSSAKGALLDDAEDDDGWALPPLRAAVPGQVAKFPQMEHAALLFLVNMRP